ncbi:Regulation of nuclear pre-mRNA domain-containing protein 2 [Astathelohania contejeani]|uniref:Regulation of nuclear pre-mRNA domain-containing protein 2 n=1 Tax=Astathelohania contejeani TaxID=164912 RepID=A0ABQ7HY68_9MICR|nr:Regulation of nuclear pre-mRNA domain-containing protein 2 [Thelohania contejeani]
MSLLSTEYLLVSLRDLTTTQDSMQTLSLYIKTNRNDYDRIIQAWLYEYKKSSVYHRLSLLYLANEIIQTTKIVDKNSKELVKAFKHSVGELFYEAYTIAESIPSVGKKYADLGKVWIDRNIFTADELFKSKKKKVEIEKKKEFERKEVIDKINAYFDSRDDLVEYLEAFINKIKNK